MVKFDYISVNEECMMPVKSGLDKAIIVKRHTSEIYIERDN